MSDTIEKALRAAAVTAVESHAEIMAGASTVADLAGGDRIESVLLNAQAAVSYQRQVALARVSSNEGLKARASDAARLRETYFGRLQQEAKS